MSKKKLLVVTLVLVLVGGATAGYVINLRNNNSIDTSQQDEDPEARQEREASEKQAAEVTKYMQGSTQRLQEQAATVKTVEDLTMIDAANQGFVGVELIRSAIEAGDTNRANSIIDATMLRSDASALDAARYCYQIATNEQRKQQCIQRMTELARALGVIGQADSLPTGYYDQSEGG